MKNLSRGRGLLGLCMSMIKNKFLAASYIDNEHIDIKKNLRKYENSLSTLTFYEPPLPPG